ncbi:MAG: hypothetical protein AUK36_00250 [Zetaproteobacteria bacterium CG2_30_59_37]|nr:MAG: hypothetical protein AUK36_00250 [Zetaproteobacteria bacterium CG2_30_59_37]
MQTSQAKHNPAADGWNNDYRRHVQKLTVSRLRITALLVIAIIILDAVAQYFFDPHLYSQLLWVRLSSVLLCLLVWRFSRHPAATRFCFPLGLLLVCIVSSDVETAIILTSGYNSPFQTGLALLIVGAGLLVPYSPGQIGVICALVWMVFLGPLLPGSQQIGSHEPGFTSSTLFMICATLITIASSIMTSGLRKREFFARMQLREEQRRSERLLLNILPAPIAARLKHGEETISDSFNDISVLFADIAGFTRMADTMQPADLVGLLNGLFSDFDTLVEQHGLEKIKTIGDAYMVVGGAPKPFPGHAARMADLALGMINATHIFNLRTGRNLEIRIGMHKGPAVAGIIGLNKFSYDLWGDSVNTASRMESHGIAGRIQISEDMYRQLRDSHLFEERGEIEIKGKGRLNTWFLLARREQT